MKGMRLYNYRAKIQVESIYNSADIAWGSSKSPSSGCEVSKKPWLSRVDCNS